MEALSWQDGSKGKGKGGQMGDGRLVWGASKGGRKGEGLGCFSIEVRGGSVEAGS